MNESEFEAELRRVQPARPSPNLAERVAAELEAELQLVKSKAVTLAPDGRLQATMPGAGLLVRSDRSESHARGFSFWAGLGWAFGGAVAAIAAILLTKGDFGQHRTRPTQLAAQPAAIAINEDPDESTAELIDTEDEGLVYDSTDSQPQRQLRLTYLERHTWTNPQTGAVIEFEVPREDVVWMPVAMQ
jgi:hypothetical protein